MTSSGSDTGGWAINEESLRQRRERARAHPEDPHVQRELCDALDQMAARLALMDQSAAASIYSEAVILRRRLVQDHSGNHSDRRALVEALRHVADHEVDARAAAVVLVEALGQAHHVASVTRWGHDDQGTVADLLSRLAGELAREADAADDVWSAFFTALGRALPHLVRSPHREALEAAIVPLLTTTTDPLRQEALGEAVRLLRGQEARAPAERDAPDRGSDHPNAAESETAPIRLDRSFLMDVGLGALPESEQKALLARIVTELELRVGTQLAEAFTVDQLEEFEKLMDAGDREASLAWLVREAPHYRDIVRKHWEVVRTELAQAAPILLAEFEATP